MDPAFIEFGVEVAKAVLGAVLIALPVGWLVVTHTVLEP